MVEAKQRAVPPLGELTVVGRTFLLPVRWALGVVEVKNDQPTRRDGRRSLDPRLVQRLQSVEITLRWENFRLEARYMAD